MAQAVPQNYENHVRVVPAYRAAFGILAINLLWCLYRVVRSFSLETVMALLMAVAVFIIFFYARVFAVTVQDRVIRLEMTLRLGQLLPADLRARIQEFSLAQLVALRFASDEELPELARRVLAENLTDRNTIKKMVQKWNPDYLRA